MRLMFKKYLFLTILRAIITIIIGLSQKRPLWSKAWCCVRLKFCSKLDDLRGGVNRTGDLGVNRTWRFEGKSSVRFTPPRNHHVRFGHMGLFIWHLVSRVFWVKFLFLSQHLKREVGFFNFTTLLLIIYSLLQYNIHLCEIYCCKCSKVALTFY